jgi:hypothetical protein
LSQVWNKGATIRRQIVVMKTCCHYRYLVPREVADELRDSDPKPCPVCDALPHRKVPQVEPVTCSVSRRVVINENPLLTLVRRCLHGDVAGFAE